MPEEVKAEIGPYFVECTAIVDEDSRKLPKLNDDTADYVKSGLTVRKRSHLFLYFSLVSLFPVDMSYSFLLLSL